MVDTETRLLNLETEIESIKERNKKVEVDKAWETSFFRILLIGAVTYTIALVFLLLAGLAHPFPNALVPTIGYVLSTQSLPFVKRWWVARRSENQKNGTE